MKSDFSRLLTPLSVIQREYEKQSEKTRRDIAAYLKDHPKSGFVRFEQYNGYADK